MNDKVKSLFFSQYLGQTVVGHECDNCNFKLTEISTIDCEVGLWGDWSGGTNPELSANDMIGIDAVWLNLRDISQLTWGQAEILLRLTEYPVGEDVEYYKLLVEKKSFAEYYFKARPVYLYEIVAIQSLLKQWGYLLPFTFLNDNNQPETYSEQKLTDLGWAKVKSNEQ